MLENRNFILGIQETWNSYLEVKVQFTQEITSHGFTYHIFMDKETNQTYYLSPRYEGQQIENVLIDNRIIVNIARRTPSIEEQPPITIGAGILKLLEK
jgi:hypothetical protein